MMSVVDCPLRRTAELGLTEHCLGIEELDSFGATSRTFRSFINACHDLIAAVRDITLPDPDLKTR
jgi:hypothetical protein